MATTFDQIVADFQDWKLPELTPRRASLSLLPRKADVVVGMRRSGKTFRLFQEIQSLISGGMERSRILYINFEDERLLPLDAKRLQEIPEALYRRFPENRGRECWYLFDEIQNIDGFEGFVRRILDQFSARVILTGSSARLLGREISTKLRGRATTTEILPFSFRESLACAKVNIPTKWPAPAEARSRLEHHFHRYLGTGGFPEVHDLDDAKRVRLLQEYMNVVLLRDVAERYSVTNITALRYLMRRLVHAPATLFSMNKIFNDLRSQGLSVGKDSLHAYLTYFEDAFLLFSVNLASTSERRRMVNPRKCYLVDHGLARAASFEADRDIGHLLENIVYVELRRRFAKIEYYITNSGHEVDFLAEDLLGNRSVIQASADISKAPTRDREVRALDEAMRECRLRESVLVTLREEELITVGSGRIRVVPAWRWLCETED
ncbi:MAG: ATP-binding protein [Planctomycetes bacterium]|nr:ATP-binding protein [Planctomycetota bacterium]